MYAKVALVFDKGVEISVLVLKIVFQKADQSNSSLKYTL